MDELRKLEKIIKKQNVYFVRDPYVNGHRPTGTADAFPELNGIPYFSLYVEIDFNSAYHAVWTTDRRGGGYWAPPVEQR